MKKLVLFFLCMVMMVQPIVAEKAEPSGWATESVQRVAGSGILDMSRLTDYHGAITRGTYAYLMYQLYEHLSGGPIINGVPITGSSMAGFNRFTDTEDLYIRALKSAGLINGYPDGSYRPDEPISREEIMSLYVRLLEKLGYEIMLSDTVFADEDQISHWAMDSVKKCYASGLIQGVGQNRLAPKGQATVEESLVVMARILNHRIYGSVPKVDTGLHGKIVSDGKTTYGIRYNIFGQVAGIDAYEDYRYLKSIYTGTLEPENLWLKEGVLLFTDGDGAIRCFQDNNIAMCDELSLPSPSHSDVVGSKRYYLDVRNHLVVEDQSNKTIYDYGEINATMVSVSWNYLVVEEVIANGYSYIRYIPLFAIEDYL